MQVPQRVIADPLDHIVELARGKRVLNVGAAGGIESYLPANRSIWLHHRLAAVSSQLVGIDIDEESIAFAARHGVKIARADCAACDLGATFDLIVLSDVIEHLNAPVDSLSNLKRHLSEEGLIAVTTPNITHFGLVIKAWLGRRVSVYYDHVTGFLPEHLVAIGNRVGLRAAELNWYTQMDRRTTRLALQSGLSKIISYIAPRSHRAFMLVLRHA
jgi:2-polyprenyl-3-methyl-5-hydroxy-6-metoxy-1,4-benzoquinol methylase